ncbi:MAG: OsmC family protein [Longimicrobiales bacterium]|nr:OsmC family protein [Longimicrobiales bacterium]
MDAKVIWRGGLGFTGSAESGFQLPLGADPEVGGEGDGFRPMELFLVGLAGCTAMDVVSIVLKKRQDLKVFEVRVEAARAEEHPRVFTEAAIRYEFTGHEIGEAAVRRAIELSATAYCPAQAMLARIMPIRLTYALFEGDSAEDREEVLEGSWEPEA